METIFIVLLVAAAVLVVVYITYGRYQKEKKGKDPAAYIDGLRALLDGREEEAFSKFRTVVAEDSQNIDAYIRIGDILRKYGKADKALQVHKDLTIRHGLAPETRVAILKALALDYVRLKDTESALAALREMIQINPRNRWALQKMLDLCVESEDWDGAFEMNEKIMKADGEKSKKGLAIYKFFQGRKLFDQKEYHRARLIFKEAIGFDPACVPAYVFMGDSYLAENRLEDAVAVWKKLIKAAPDESHLVVGRLKKALFELGRFSETTNICNEILAAAPKNLHARLTLADYHYKKGEYDTAGEHLGIAIDEHPESFIPLLDLAKLYLTTGEKDKLGGLISRLEELREGIEHQYSCSRCGHKSMTRLWICPVCKAVDSFSSSRTK